MGSKPDKTLDSAPYMRIGEACKKLGIPPYLLRFWEREIPYFRVHRSHGGLRLYSKQDILIVRRLHELIHVEGYSLKTIKTWVRQRGLEILLQQSPEQDKRPREKKVEEKSSPSPTSWEEGTILRQMLEELESFIRSRKYDPRHRRDREQ